MGRHTAFDDLGSAARVDMISDMLSGMNIVDLTLLNGVIEDEIKTRSVEVLKMRKRFQNRRIQRYEMCKRIQNRRILRYKKQDHLFQGSENVVENSENSDVSGIDDQSDDQDSENEEYVTTVMKDEPVLDGH